MTRRAKAGGAQLGLDMWVSEADTVRAPLALGEWVAVSPPGGIGTERGQVWAEGAGAFVLVALEATVRAVELCTARTCRERGCGRWHEATPPAADALF